MNEEIEKIVQKIANQRSKILERFLEAYLAETGLMPSECELCEVHDGLSHRWFFRKRETP